MPGVLVNDRQIRENGAAPNWLLFSQGL